MALVSLLSPAKLTSGVTGGFGPAFIFPTGTSQANIQYLFGDSWQTGMAPNILIDWKADQENRFTVPVGLGIGKLVKIGPLLVKFTAEVDYMVVRPEDFGQHWGVRFQIVPVLPALFKETLF